MHIFMIHGNVAQYENIRKAVQYLVWQSAVKTYKKLSEYSTVLFGNHKAQGVTRYTTRTVLSHVVKPRPSVLLAGWAITHAVQQSHRGVGAVTHAVQQSHRGAGDLSADWRECREDDLKLKGRIITGQLGASLRWNRLIAREQIIQLELLHRRRFSKLNESWDQQLNALLT